MRTKRRKTKGKITEEGTIKLLQRYGATAIITLLQEVAQSADMKIDWKAIVKRSSTGIANPREYQLLWRHLAYCDPLMENIDGTEPTDDDSDLEFELETDPAVGPEVTLHAEACVKVLMPTSFSSESGPPNNPAAVHSVMLTGNGFLSNATPSDKEHAVPPACGKNITYVSLHKQTASREASRGVTGPPVEGFEGNEATAVDSTDKKRTELEGNEAAAAGLANKKRRVEGFVGNDAAGVGSVNIKGRAEGLEGNDAADAGSAPKKKRKPWTEEEDRDLRAAVQKFGEGNWVNILKEHFTHGRTPAQLSQRWYILKRGQASKSKTAQSRKSINFVQSEVLDAARFALNNALGMPMARSFPVMNAGLTRSATLPNISRSSSSVPEVLCRSSPVQKPNLRQEATRIMQEASDQATPEKRNVIPVNHPQTTPKSPPASVKPPICTTSSLIKAAAYAAGGRIVPPSAAASLLKAAQSKNVVHIRAGGSQLTSTVNKGQQQSNSCLSHRFMMPPPPGNSVKVKGNVLTTRHKRGSLAAGAQQSSGSSGNAEKTNHEETSAVVRKGGLSTGEAERGDEMNLNGSLNQGEKNWVEVGEEDSRREKANDITVDNSNVTSTGVAEGGDKIKLVGASNQEQMGSMEVNEKDSK